MMIITRLIGGLGNQMFQYAIARSIAHVNKTDIKLDVSVYESHEGWIALPRHYELKNLNIIENVANMREIEEIKGKNRRFQSILEKIPFRSSNRLNCYYKEKEEFYCDSKVFGLKGSIYLEGYFQTEKYFKNIEELIKNDFMVRTEADETNQSLLDKIRSSNAVAVHVRRGDNTPTDSIHGVCSSNYYRKGIEIIAEEIADPHFFIFSNDAKWAKRNLQTHFPSTYVSHNGIDKGYEDMRLMRNCKHFLIANSTFSWWGAWLSRNPDKIVLAPKRWFKKPGYRNTRDLIPESWRQIDLVSLFEN